MQHGGCCLGFWPRLQKKPFSQTGSALTRKAAGSRWHKKAEGHPSWFAAQWLKERNEKSEIGPDDADVQKFQKTMGETIRRLYN